LAVLDARDARVPDRVAEAVAGVARVIWVHNKSDLAGLPARTEARGDGLHLWLSATRGEGLEALREALRQAGGGDAEGEFSARERHVVALARCAEALSRSGGKLRDGHAELAAEELRLAQQALGEITGTLAPDDLLGRIFADFCIGK
jgi:tRNA modification GTPase